MLELQNISKNYKTTRALSDFSYTFGHGVYGILGPNGSGKSTLMNIITGNLKHDCGTIRMSSNTARSIGYVPQYPGLYGDFTAYEVMDYTARLCEIPHGQEKTRELLEAFELVEYENRRVRALSGGTKQRLAIAQAFVGSPELIVLDEPTAGLDPMQRILFKNFIRKHREDTTIIISTHIVSDKVIFLRRGAIANAGTVSNMVESMKNKCWLLPPHVEYTNGFCRVVGDRIRMIADYCTILGAESVIPELDDIYLYIFGEEGASNST